MVRIGYCLLVHKNPKQVGRLLNSIYSDSDLFYINVFDNIPSKEEWQKEIGKPGVIASYKYGKSWGEFPVVNAILNAMQRFSRSNYDYFINLTGQCYPLKSNSEIKQFFQDRNIAFMEVLKLPAPRWGSWGGLDRIMFSYYKHPVSVFRAQTLNYLLGYRKFETRKLLRLPKLETHLPYGLKPYGGSAYFCITKKHVDYILGYLKEHPKLIKFFMHSFAPDELFFHTILLNSELRKTIVNNNLRYIDWTKPGPVPLSPAELTMEDAEKLLHSSALFARKFDIEKDEAILDLIDKHRSEVD